jgi:hypothetical protein
MIPELGPGPGGILRTHVFPVGIIALGKPNLTCDKLYDSAQQRYVVMQFEVVVASLPRHMAA